MDGGRDGNDWVTNTPHKYHFVIKAAHNTVTHIHTHAHTPLEEMTAPS